MICLIVMSILIILVMIWCFINVVVIFLVGKWVNCFLILNFFGMMFIIVVNWVFFKLFGRMKCVVLFFRRKSLLLVI